MKLKSTRAKNLTFRNSGAELVSRRCGLYTRHYYLFSLSGISALSSASGSARHVLRVNVLRVNVLSDNVLRVDTLRVQQLGVGMAPQGKAQVS